MADPRNAQSASRLSEDIGDVLNAIRRMIAEDDALSTTRERLIAERDALDSLVQEDAGEFLARRYGGNAALARRLAGITESPVEGPDPAEESWPLGDRANAPDAMQPTQLASVNTPEPERRDQPRNDLARILSAGIAQPQQPTEANVGQTSDAPRGWRAWVAPEPRPSRWAAGDFTDEAPEPAADSFEALVAQADFDEVFDWKSRMRPDLDDLPSSQPSLAANNADERLLPVQIEDDVAGVASPISSSADPQNDVVTAPSPYVATAFYDPFSGYQAVLGTSGLSGAIANQPKVAIAGSWALPVENSVTGSESLAVAAVNLDAEVAQPAMPETVVADQVEVVEDVAKSGALLLSDATIIPAADAELVSTEVPNATITGLTPEDEEASIRDLLREMIQEELQGELGERFSRNIRAVIRREVAAAIDAHLERC